MIKAEVLAHSITKDGAEAITMRINFWRGILPEVNTHRKLGKNTSSSRAVPISKMIRNVLDTPFVPEYFGKNQPGMQAETELTGFKRTLATTVWRASMYAQCGFAGILSKLGAHKQLSNRLIEGFSYISMVFTTTDINNLLVLRQHKDAQPEFRALANAMYDAYNKSEAKRLSKGEWHLPFVTEEQKATLSIEDQITFSVACCASTSYETVDKRPMTIEIAKRIVDKLINTDHIHASPFEHQLTPDELVEIEYRIAKSKKKYQTATVWENPHLHGNTIGFKQYRKSFANESSTLDNPHYLIIERN